MRHQEGKECPLKFLLLGTSGCHLCEEAEQIINDCLQTKPNVQIELIDIAEFDCWQQDYATLIPVLLHEATAQTLLWPFSHQQVNHFFEAIKS
jgi:fumarate hydratase, class II